MIEPSVIDHQQNDHRVTFITIKLILDDPTNFDLDDINSWIVGLQSSFDQHLRSCNSGTQANFECLVTTTDNRITTVNERRL